MLVFIIGFLFLVAALFSYGNQDQLRLFDSGEEKMAAAILSRHGKVVTSCVLPGAGAYCARDGSTNPVNPEPASAGGPRIQSRYLVNDEADMSVPVDSIVSVVQDGRLFTFGMATGGVAGANRAATLRPALTTARLSHYLVRYGEASLEQRPGSYDRVAGRVRFADRKTPRSLPFDPGVAGIMIPDGAPAMISPALTTAIPATTP